jgi:hypothetical protein
MSLNQESGKTQGSPASPMRGEQLDHREMKEFLPRQVKGFDANQGSHTQVEAHGSDTTHRNQTLRIIGKRFEWYELSTDPPHQKGYRV